MLKLAAVDSVTTVHSRLRFSAIALCALMSACQSSPTTPASNGYSGEWSGTTAQGRPLTFTISSDERVTTITIGHDFNGCTGVQTFLNLSLAIAPNVTCIPGPCPPGVSSYRAINYGSDRIEGRLTSINGVFLTTSRVEGTVNFDFPGCGNVVGLPWSAVKR